VFSAKTIRYALLKAECQSGKTGAFHELIRQMLRSGEIQRAYILCGSHETELRNQAIDDAKELNKDVPIKVLFRQDFKGFKMDIRNALIVVDESHMDAGAEQMMSKFLGKHGMSMDGNPAALDKENAFLLSVSATPYAEICAMQHKETPFPKHVENLISGDNYFGLAQYKYGGLLKPTFDVAKQPQLFEELFTDKPKYALLRLSSHGKHASKQHAAIVAICKKKGYKVSHFTAEKNDIKIEDLKNAPSVNTVIIIRGRLRAGKVVPKKHIAFVWEGAESSHTDALVQGLPGRMCGYEFGETKPLIFVPPKALKDNEKKVVKGSEIDRAILCSEIMVPQKAPYLKPGSVPLRASNGKTQCPPIRLVDEGHYKDGDAEWGTGFTHKLGDMDEAEFRLHCYELLKKNIHLIDENTLLSAEQKKEILEEIIPSGVPSRGGRRFGDDPKRSYYKNLLEAYATGTAPAEHISDYNPLNFVGWKGSNTAGANKRHIYAIFYTKASPGVGGVMQAPLTARVARTNGKSQFSAHSSDFKEPIVAGGVVGFNEASAKTPIAFEKAMRNYLTLFKESELEVARKIESASERFKLDKRTFAYKGAKDNKVEEICKRLGAEFGLKMEVKYARGSMGAGGH